MRDSSSVLTQRAKLLFDELEARYEVIKKALGDVPLGLERVNQSEYRRRFAAMTPEQRVQEIKRVGFDQLKTWLAKGEENGARTQEQDEGLSG